MDGGVGRRSCGSAGDGVVGVGGDVGRRTCGSAGDVVVGLLTTKIAGLESLAAHTGQCTMAADVSTRLCSKRLCGYAAAKIFPNRQIAKATIT